MAISCSEETDLLFSVRMTLSERDLEFGTSAVWQHRVVVMHKHDDHPLSLWAPVGVAEGLTFSAYILLTVKRRSFLEVHQQRDLLELQRMIVG